MTFLSFLLVYFLGMVATTAIFIWLNMSYRWVTKRTYAYTDGTEVFFTVVSILLYPIAVIVWGFILVWRNYIPDNERD